jgi:eukaryotic-like serine/threonine-protein kinase
MFALLVGLLVAAGLAGFAFAVFRGDGDGSAGSDDGGEGVTSEIALQAASDYDPEGDDSEHPEDVAAATDGDPATYWTTETYGSFDKSGVGIVVRSSAPIDGGSVVVRSDDDSGYTAEIRASTRAGGGFETVSEAQTVGRRTTFQLDTGGEEYRFLLVWITELGPNSRAHVNEVAFRS